MRTFVIDASVAIKWVVDEDESAQALALRKNSRLIAPDLLVAECANILWKKVQRGEIEPQDAKLASDLLARADVALEPMNGLSAEALRLAVQLGHPAYDCFYLALALARRAIFVTADARFARAIAALPDQGLAAAVLCLRDMPTG